MKCLVTGATGFIGSNLCNRLYQDGHEVFALGRNREQKPNCHKLMKRSLEHIWWHRRRFKDIEVVFHLAANNDTTDLDEESMMRTNLQASQDMFHAFSLKKCKKIIYASSTAIYGNSPAPYVENKTKIAPLNPYAESKAALEKFADNLSAVNNIKIIGLRYCNVYGPGEDHKKRRASMIYQLLKQMMNGYRPKIFKNGEQRRDWVFVHDVVEANIKAMEYENSGVFNCGSGQAYTFNEVVSEINNQLGTNLEPEYIDNPYENRYQSYTCCDMNYAKKELRHIPQYDLKSGITELIKVIT
jgi:ADP-L-glycero-D-manno-heptose 6-epimerase